MALTLTVQVSTLKIGARIACRAVDWNQSAHARLVVGRKDGLVVYDADREYLRVDVPGRKVCRVTAGKQRTINSLQRSSYHALIITQSWLVKPTKLGGSFSFCDNIARLGVKHRSRDSRCSVTLFSLQHQFISLSTSFINVEHVRALFFGNSRSKQLGDIVLGEGDCYRQ